jgi:isopenicillin N synthase-like dioxygenase
LGLEYPTIVHELDKALREYGFFYVINHGIDANLIQEQFDISSQLFDLPLTTKVTMPFDPELDIGYLASGGQAVGLTKQQQSSNDSDKNNMTVVVDDADKVARMEQMDQIDTKEQFMMTNNKLITNKVPSTTTEKAAAAAAAASGNVVESLSTLTNNCIPSSMIASSSSSSILDVDPDDVFAGSKNYDLSTCIPDHKRVTSAYMSAAYKLNVRLQEYLFDAIALTEDDKTKTTNGQQKTNNDDDVRHRLGAHPFLVLKQMKYYAGLDGLPSDPSVGRYGAGPHTDWGSFTILATDQTPGLQIYRPEYGTWLDVPPLPGALIINAGDQISILTNQVYKSALHRVLIYKEYIHKPRFSTAIFAYFGMDATFGPLPQFTFSDDDDDEGKKTADLSLGRTTREYFHYKLHQSVFGVTGRNDAG